MNAKELQRLTRKYTATLDGIAALMEADKITEADGEVLLLYLAGLSAGVLSRPYEPSTGPLVGTMR